MTLSFPKALFSNSAKYYGESAIGGSMGVLPVTIATNWDDSEQQESSFVWGYESKESGGREEEIVNSRERVR